MNRTTTLMFTIAALATRETFRVPGVPLAADASSMPPSNRRRKFKPSHHANRGRRGSNRGRR